jgi:hypothetical protein
MGNPERVRESDQSIGVRLGYRSGGSRDCRSRLLRYRLTTRFSFYLGFGPRRSLPSRTGPLFTRVPGETVWKLVEDVSTVRFWGQERADRVLFAPSWRPSETPFGTHPDIPNSFGRGVLGSPHSGSCIDHRFTVARRPSEDFWAETLQTKCCGVG